MNNIISIVVPCYNSQETLHQTLKSILELRIPSNKVVEIIAIDNGSTDNTKNIILSYDSVSYYYEPIKNRSKARNHGVKKSRGDIICFIDSDVIVNINWLEIMLEKLESSNYFAGGEGKVLSKALGKFNVYEELRLLIKKNSHSLLELRGRRFPGINTAACIYRREAFLEVKGFDENLNYHEDVDLSQSIFRAGHALFYEEQAVCNCFNSSANTNGFTKRTYFSSKEMMKYEKKWFNESVIASWFGFIISLFKCYAGVTKDYINKKVSFKLVLVRYWLYFVSLVGSIFGIVGALKVNTKNSSIGLILNDEGEWGIVELSNCFILKNLHDNNFKSIPKILPIDHVIKKYNHHLINSLKSFLLRYKEEMDSAFLVGSFLNKKRNQLVSSQDIDIVIMAHSVSAKESILNDLTTLGKLLNKRFDISVFTLFEIEHLSIFISKAIHISPFSYEGAFKLFGKKSTFNYRSKNDNNIYMFYLLLKKLKYYILDNNQEVIFDNNGHEVNLINYYKFIKYSESPYDDQRKLINDLREIKGITNSEKKSLSTLHDRHLRIGIKEFITLRPVLIKVFKKQLIRFLKNKNQFIKGYKSIKLPPDFEKYISLDSLFVGQNVDSRSYSQRFDETVKDSIKRLEEYAKS